MIEGMAEGDSPDHRELEDDQDPCAVDGTSGTLVDGPDALPGLRLINTAHTPLVDENGAPRSRVQPYSPVLNACRLCPARCCRMRVTLSLPEVLAFCADVGLPVFSGLTVFPSDHPTRSFEVAADARFVESDGSWSGRGEFRLRSTDSGECIALLRLGGYERCGVYAARPFACRTYPVSWESDSLCGGVEVILCPVPYAVSPDEERRILADIRRGREAWASHEEVVTAWNRRREGASRSFDDFLEFGFSRIAPTLGVRWPDLTAMLDRRSPADRLAELQRASFSLRPARSLADGGKDAQEVASTDEGTEDGP